MTLIYQAERDASDYFNSLPIEQRRKLAPLLEHYRLMGMDEAMVALRGVTRKLDERMRGIVEHSEAHASERTQPVPAPGQKGEPTDGD